MATAGPGGGGSRSRIPMPVLIGGVIAAVVAAGGVGLALGASNDGPRPTTQGLPTPAPTGAAVASPTPRPIVSLAPVPTSGQANPTPRPEPTRAPTPAPVGGTIETEYLSIAVPETWEVTDQDATYITFFTPSGGLFHIESGFVDEPTTAQELLDGEIQRRVSSYPDVEVCIAESEDPLPNGPAGRGIGLCYTATTSSGSTFPATLYVQYAVTDGGTTAYMMKILSDDQDWDAVVADAVSVFDSIRWKLYTGE